MPNQDTDLISYVIQSIEKYPHQWVLENNELENVKAKITVNKLSISTIDDQGRPLVQSLDSVFGGTFNAILRHYNDYVVLLTQHRVKQLFPLDLYYEILENIDEHFNDWTQLSEMHLHNEKMKIDIEVDLSIFSSKSTINGLNISNEQATKLLMTYTKSRGKNQNLQQSLAQVDDLRNSLKNK
jgi:hypothetical protein